MPHLHTVGVAQRVRQQCTGDMHNDIRKMIDGQVFFAGEAVTPRQHIPSGRLGTVTCPLQASPGNK